MNPSNPFLTQGYLSAEYFCDRKVELKLMQESLVNGNNLALISGRRKGKTNLILHLFHHHKSPAVYIDIFNARNESDFVQQLSRAIVQQLGTPKESFVKKLSRTVRSFRPNIGFNPITGEPELGIQFSEERSSIKNLEDVFGFLSQEYPGVLIAIDEFQQILSWENPGVEAELRSLTQRYPLIRFIYCGSSRKLMFDLFNNSRRPFYHSSQLLFLEKINPDLYLKFITSKLSDRILTENNIRHEIIWCRGETYYIQRLFNRIYGKGPGTYNRQDLDQIESQLIAEKESEFQIQLRLLAKQQRSLLIALALSKGIDKPTSAEFLKQYSLSSSSTIAQNLNVLIEKDMVIKDEGLYRVADVFLEHWIQGSYGKEL